MQALSVLDNWLIRPLPSQQEEGMKAMKTLLLTRVD